MEEVYCQSFNFTPVVLPFLLCCRENFLQVDIFYKELSYEKIEQQPAFEFLSLLSEVGGFLGLLLGASVLTVCELIDFVAVFFIDRYQPRNNNKLLHEQKV